MVTLYRSALRQFLQPMLNCHFFGGFGLPIGLASPEFPPEGFGVFVPNGITSSPNNSSSSVAVLSLPHLGQ